MASKRERFTDPKKVLGEKEYKKYRELMVAEKKRKLREKIKRLKQGEKGIGYGRTKTGKFGRGIKKSVGFLSGGLTSGLYGRKYSTTSSGGSGTGKRGRPRGSVKYRHPVTGQPIGVYEYRKLLSLERMKLKQRLNERSAFNPDNLARLRRMQEIERMRRLSPESQVIPDTHGDVSIGHIMGEIKDASEALP